MKVKVQCPHCAKWYTFNIDKLVDGTVSIVSVGTEALNPKVEA